MIITSNVVLYEAVGYWLLLPQKSQPLNANCYGYGCWSVILEKIKFLQRGAGTPLCIYK